MKKNIIILTHGWSGSSVYAALFGCAGYWLGSETVKKSDYDTFENSDLVGLNKELLRTLAPDIDHEYRFAFEDVSRIEHASETLNLQPYRDFVARASAHTPWLWKDPRLTWTIRVWAKVIALEQTAFLVLTRDDLQGWITANQRRNVQSMRFTQQYNHGITRSNVRFLEDRHLPFLQLSFEDLLLEPEKTIGRINEFFGLELSLSDLHRVCRAPLYRKSRGWKDFVLAALIYAKNFRERDGRARRSRTSSASSSM
jgi:hypothetical protein